MHHDVKVPRDRLWKFISDTERFNRLINLFTVSYEYRPRSDGGSDVYATAHTPVMKMRWREDPAEWQEPEFLRFTRHMLNGPFLKLEVRLDLTETDNPQVTHVEVNVHLTPRNWIGSVLAKTFIARETKAGYYRGMRMAEDWHRSGILPVAGKERSKATRRHIRLFSSELGPMASAIGSTDVGQALLKHLTTQPDSELGALRPYVLADQWQLPRKSVLRTMLHASQRGLMDLHWRLLCPSCRGSNETHRRLKDVPKEGHCPACNLSYTADFDRAIEAVFKVEKIGLGKEAAKYCHFSPQNTPHRVAAWRLKPGETRTVDLDLPAGAYQFICPQSKGGQYFWAEQEQLSDGEVAASCGAHVVEVSCDSVTGMPQRIEAGPLQVAVHSQLPNPGLVYLVQADWADGAVTAADLTAMQEFRDLFEGETLAPGISFGISTLTFLFSDLVASTAMYEQMGDHRAFALVRRHFDLLRKIYQRNNGTLVKTIGDAVMAVFREPSDGLRAALEMHQEVGTVRDPASGNQLRLCIGLHVGPCIAMSANGIIDYFGTTVNQAARIQSMAGAGEVTVSEEMLASPGVGKLISEMRASKRETRRLLKGLAGERTIARIYVPGAAESAVLPVLR